jgi:hypothetical protein
MTLQEAVGLVRLLIERGIAREDAIANPAIPREMAAVIRETLEREDAIVLEPPRVLVAQALRDEWLRGLDRSSWYYWPTLRDYLLTERSWPAPTVRSLDEATDRVLGQLAYPTTEYFDVRGLVLGFVQSGKTANFTAVIAKAADVGYRLVIVLSGIDNGLRRQTQIRLKRELVGYTDNRRGAVRLPPLGRQWHEFTREDLEGDFRAGFANQAALQGSQPVLLVVKKNGPVLRRLLRWLDEAPDAVRRTIPLLVIDDEADQASVDTRGSYQTEAAETAGDDYEPPSVINGLIRNLLSKFQKRAYVAYTATPFANILIPHDTFDPRVANDLYPKDFIVDLPRPEGYFGAEELFGRLDSEAGEQIAGIDVVRQVPDQDVSLVEQGQLAPSLELAMIDFVLAGAARAQRGQKNEPATMLVHVSRLVVDQQRLAAAVEQRFGELRDEWRYHRAEGIVGRLTARWDSEFRLVTRASHVDRDAPFSRIERHIGEFFESVRIRVVNSFTGEVLDYEREPGLKAIAVGGNRLSRGLTLEGLMMSYFVRRSVMYDTLMQMGRWFGFRAMYEDLTRIYTTPELASWFSDLAHVEHRLREDIRIYEDQQLTPYEVGMRIYQHPTMQVTSPPKSRFASRITISQSYSLQIEQTFKFPLRRLDDLTVLGDANLAAVRGFAQRLGRPEWADSGPIWRGVSPDAVLEFLNQYQVDDQSRSVSLSLIRAYIDRQVATGELVRWAVAVRGLRTRDRTLGDADWGVHGGKIHQISRTRIKDSDSLGVITSPGDEELGLSEDALARMREFTEAGDTANVAARKARPAEEGLLLLYPISRRSGHDLEGGGIRRRLYEDPSDHRARDLIALAISFPQSRQPQPLEAYWEGTAGWRPVE